MDLKRELSLMLPGLSDGDVTRLWVVHYSNYNIWFLPLRGGIILSLYSLHIM